MLTGVVQIGRTGRGFVHARHLGLQVQVNHVHGFGGQLPVVEHHVVLTHLVEIKHPAFLQFLELPGLRAQARRNAHQRNAHGLALTRPVLERRGEPQRFSHAHRPAAQRRFEVHLAVGAGAGRVRRYSLCRQVVTPSIVQYNLSTGG